MLGNLYARYPGLPVSILGAGTLVFGIVHYVRADGASVLVGAETALVCLLAIGIVYGGHRASTRDISPFQGILVFAWTLVFALFGFVVAAALITFQMLKGVPIQDSLYLMLAAAATTATVGVLLSLYYYELRTERAELLAQNERVRSLNKLLAVLQRVLRHNLRNEVTVILGYLEHLETASVDGDQRQCFRTIREHTHRVGRLSETAQSLKRVWEVDELVQIDVVAVVEESVAVVEANHPDVDVRTDVPDSAAVVAHPKFDLALTEALENAVVHNDVDETDVTAAVSRRDGGDGGPVDVRVADTGSGIPPLEKAVLEQPYEEPLRHASGLGLWLIYWIVRKSGGDLRFEDNEPTGTVVRMRLQATDD